MSAELTAFLAWAEENEIIWDKDAVEVKSGEHGLGLYAKKNLEEGFEVVQVPKSAILSVESSGIANLLNEEAIEGYVALTVAYMYETSRGTQSPWSSYLALLNSRPVAMATSLSAASLELLKASEAHADVETDLKDLKSDYEEIVVPFMETQKDIFTDALKEFFTLEAFTKASAQVSSRSMDVDNFHVSALVPFADLVNHSSTPNSDYLTHEDVCEICGALACEHMEDEEDTDEEEDDEEEEKASKEKKGADDDEEMPDLEAKDGEDKDWESDDEEINDTCDIVLDCDVKKGEEITRIYGQYPNRVLLSKYGFAEIGNPFDTVTVQLDMVRQVAIAMLKSEEVTEERISWFLENEEIFIGEDDDEEHEGGCCGEDHDHDHDHSHGHKHEHKDGCCDDKEESKEKSEKETEESKEDEEEDEEDDEDDEDEFPRDIFYLLEDGLFDDRLFMLLNILYLPAEKFAAIKDDHESCALYFNDIFASRMGEEEAEEGDEEEEKETPVEKTPEEKEAAKEIQKEVLKATLALIQVRADAFGITNKTTAEEDLKSLKAAKLSGPTHFGAICVHGEKAILQEGFKRATIDMSNL